MRGVTYKAAVDLHEELDDSSYVLLRANNIQDGELRFDDVQYVDRAKVKQKQLLRRGDILFCASSGSKGLVGKAALVRENMPVTFGAFCCVLRPKENEAEYLAHYFQSQQYRRAIEKVCSGSNINNLKAANFFSLVVPHYDDDSTRVISALFDSIDAQIKHAKDQIANHDSLVKSRFNEMFGGCSAKVGADWPSVSISEVVQKPKSGEWGEEDLVGDGIKVLRTTNFTDTGVVDYAKVVTRQIDRKKLTNKGLKHGDILIEKSGGSDKKPVGRVVLFEGEDNVYLNNNFTAALRIKDATEVDYHYLFHFMYMNYWQGGTRSFESKTTGLHNLKLGDYLAKTIIAVPPIGNQRDFSAFVCQVDKLRFTTDGPLKCCATSFTPFATIMNGSITPFSRTPL